MIKNNPKTQVRWRQEDQKFNVILGFLRYFEATLGYVRPSFGTNKLGSKKHKKECNENSFSILHSVFSRGNLINSFLSFYFSEIFYA